jgi:hypothetical protein
MAVKEGRIRCTDGLIAGKGFKCQHFQDVEVKNKSSLGHLQGVSILKQLVAIKFLYDNTGWNYALVCHKPEAVTGCCLPALGKQYLDEFTVPVRLCCPD